MYTWIYVRIYIYIYKKIDLRRFAAPTSQRPCWAFKSVPDGLPSLSQGLPRPALPRRAFQGVSQGVPRRPRRLLNGGPPPGKASQGAPKASQGVPQEPPKASQKASKIFFEMLKNHRKNKSFALISLAPGRPEIGPRWLMLVHVTSSRTQHGLSWLT